MTKARAAKLAKIKTLSENAATPEEAANAIKMLADLSEEWGIEDAMIENHREGRSIHIDKLSLPISSGPTYARAWATIAWNLAVGLGCSAIIAEGTASGQTEIRLVGAKSDLERFEILWPDVDRQAQLGLNRHVRDNIESWMNATRKYNERKGYLLGFASGLGSKLAESRADAIRARGSGAELVLAERRELVDIAAAAEFGKTRKIHQSARGSGYGVGQRDGQRVNVGNRPREVGA
jgi:hypothetical protein